MCGRAKWEEHVDRSECPTGIMNDKLLLHQRARHLTDRPFIWPDLDGYMKSVELFNARKLTHDEDVLDAFAGVQNLHSPGFSGKMLWGIPEVFFDHCILWQPSKPLRRRKLQCQVRKYKELPSWSWVGWEGDISFNCDVSPPIRAPGSRVGEVQIVPLLRPVISCEGKLSVPPRRLSKASGTRCNERTGMTKPHHFRRVGNETHIPRLIRTP